MNYRRITALLLLSVTMSQAYAGSSENNQQQQQQQQTSSQADSVATNQGNSQSILFMSPDQTRTTVSGTQTVRNTPSVSAPALTSSNDTCMGSVSGSANGAGFGVSFGTTFKDANCVMLKNSRELWNMGMRAAALARMCMDEDNREALEITGYECPKRALKSQEATSVSK